MSKVYVNDIWVEDLFKWFHEHVSNSGGDGAAAICCSNPDEVAEWFIEWWRGQATWFKGDGFKHPRHEYTHDNIRFINYHDSNENYIFCDKEVDLGHHDYSFVVTGDCRWGWTNQDKGPVKRISDE